MAFLKTKKNFFQIFLPIIPNLPSSRRSMLYELNQERIQILADVKRNILKTFEITLDIQLFTNIDITGFLLFQSNIPKVNFKSLFEDHLTGHWDGVFSSINSDTTPAKQNLNVSYLCDSLDWLNRFELKTLSITPLTGLENPISSAGTCLITIKII